MVQCIGFTFSITYFSVNHIQNDIEMVYLTHTHSFNNTNSPNTVCNNCTLVITGLKS